jgi:hypothetical protein
LTDDLELHLGDLVLDIITGILQIVHQAVKTEAGIGVDELQAAKRISVG